MIRVLALAALAVTTACHPAARPAGARPAASAAGATLVESVPVETTLDHPEVPDAPEVWLEMVRGARRTLDFAEFYASEAEAPEQLAGSKLAPIVEAIEAAAARGVRVRFLADAKFAKTYPQTLDRLAGRGVAVRRLDVATTSGGVLHAKYFVVDGEEAFVGSQNFDWRALQHIFELGLRVSSEAFAGALLDVFDTDWELAGGAAPATRVRTRPRAIDLAAGDGGRITFAASPRGWLPHEEDWDLPRLVAAIDAATTRVEVELLTYKVRGRDGQELTDLDAALRRAAGRGARVRLLVADWSVRPDSDGRRALEALATVAGIEVRVLRIPKWSGGDIPFARVAHAKFMVVDGATAWLGTSNWERDYFFGSRNVGAFVSGGAIPAQLAAIFDGNWGSAYAGPL